MMRAYWKIELFLLVASVLDAVSSQPSVAMRAEARLQSATPSTMTRDLLFWFPSVHSLLEVQELSAFSDLTQDFLQFVGGLKEIKSLVVTAQSMQSIDKLPLSNVILMEAGDNMLTEYLSKEMALSIQVRVEAVSDTKAIVSLLSNNWESYIAFLISGGLGKFRRTFPVASPETNKPPSNASSNQASFAWVLVVLLVSLAALMVVILARRSGRRRHHTNIPGAGDNFRVHLSTAPEGMIIDSLHGEDGDGGNSLRDDTLSQ